MSRLPSRKPPGPAPLSLWPLRKLLSPPAAPCAPLLHSYSNLPNTNSATVSSRKPSLTGLKLAQLLPESLGFRHDESHQGPLWSSILTLQCAFPKLIPVQSPPFLGWPSTHYYSWPGQIGRSGCPRVLGRCPDPAQRGSLSAGEFHKVHLDQQLFPSPRRPTGGSEPGSFLNNPSNKSGQLGGWKAGVSTAGVSLH